MNIMSKFKEIFRYMDPRELGPPHYSHKPAKSLPKPKDIVRCWVCHQLLGKEYMVSESCEAYKLCKGCYSKFRNNNTL